MNFTKFLRKTRLWAREFQSLVRGRRDVGPQSSQGRIGAVVRYQGVSSGGEARAGATGGVAAAVGDAPPAKVAAMFKLCFARAELDAALGA